MVPTTANLPQLGVMIAARILPFKTIAFLAHHFTRHYKGEPEPFPVPYSLREPVPGTQGFDADFLMSFVSKGENLERRWNSFFLGLEGFGTRVLAFEFHLRYLCIRESWTPNKGAEGLLLCRSAGKLPFNLKAAGNLRIKLDLRECAI